uniref:DUF3299 domain-containing protein n=1 Tax=Limnohabitans sp. TaxID=1907725 RepID=UPI0040483114
MEQVTRSWQTCLLMAVLGASAAQAQSVRESVRETVPQVQPALSADNAPINPLILGESVRLPGYVVPLEDLAAGIKEFLLVPYFGACVHSPPPPANQIVHVLLDKPAKNLRLMDVVWVNGPLSATKTDSHMGVASYRIDAKAVTPYQEKKR